jgi:hypothetical protein
MISKQQVAVAILAVAIQMICTLAQNFGVGLDTAKQTLKATTQRGLRSILNPTLS